jgi:hypothetical protein
VFSVPILVFSSLFIVRLLDAYPLIIDAGAALLGWIAGKTAVSDPAIAGLLDTQSFGLVAAAPVLGAVYVLIQGRRLRAERSGLDAGRDPAHGPADRAAPVSTPVSAPVSAPLSAPRSAPRSTHLSAPLAPALLVAAGAPPELSPTNPEPGPATASAGSELPRRFTPMDLTIMAGVVVPLLGLIVMIVYFVVHAATAH